MWQQDWQKRLMTYTKGGADLPTMYLGIFWSAFNTLLAVYNKDRRVYPIGSSSFYSQDEMASHEFATVKVVNTSELHAVSHTSLWIQANSYHLHYSIMQYFYTIVFSDLFVTKDLKWYIFPMKSPSSKVNSQSFMNKSLKSDSATHENRFVLYSASDSICKFMHVVKGDILKSSS